MSLPFESISGRSGSTGPGDAHDLESVKVNHFVVFHIDSLSGTGIVQGTLEVSEDNSVWIQSPAGVAEPSDSGTSVLQTSFPARYVRANVTQWDVGISGTLSATVVSY